MKKFVAIILVVLSVWTFVACVAKTPSTSQENIEEDIKIDDNSMDLSHLMPVAVFEMSDGATFEVELYKDIAPITVKNFIKLAQNGFYNGTLIHRIVDSGISIIQGGGYFLDQDNSRYTKPAENIYGEFTENGFVNEFSHQEGVISMARTPEYNSASSQFFICYADCSGLDGRYATFGKVRSGMDVVKSIAKIAKGDMIKDDIIIKTVTIKYVQK